jgi:hypothetical protein
MTKDLNKSEEEEISNIKVQNIIVRMINEWKEETHKLVSELKKKMNKQLKKLKENSSK